MQYRHSCRGREFTSSVVGLPNPRWAWESFALESNLREEWWDVKPGSVVVDAGAGFGSYALSALAQGADYVLACEPDKEALFALLSNLHANPGFARHCAALPVCLTDVRDVVVGYDHVFHSASVATPHPMEHRYGETVDGLCERYKLPRLDWLKIDVEGGEAAVLRGALRTLRAARPKVLVENHLKFAPDVLETIDKIMRPLGYEPRHRKGEGDNDNWTLWTPR